MPRLKRNYFILGNRFYVYSNVISIRMFIFDFINGSARIEVIRTLLVKYNSLSASYRDGKLKGIILCPVDCP